MTQSPAGWYPANGMPGTLRYWNGSEWTEHVAPVGQEQRSSATSSNEVVAWVTAVLVPFVGAIIGVVMLAKGENKGAGVLGLSVLSGLFWLLFYFA